VGKALEYLMELRLERGPISEDEAYRLLDEWWGEQNDPGDAEDHKPRPPRS
jgi:hypothetical protein